METRKKITVEEFVGVLLSRLDICDSGDALTYGLHQGWLEEQDKTVWQKPIERRAAARIVHEFLRREWGQQDEQDWGPARKLKDLYDCRTCANHVAQVFAKGIMTGKGEDVFGMREGMTEAEGAEIAERMLKIKQNAPRNISYTAMLELLKTEKKALIADVRTRQEYERGHIPNAFHIPFTALLEKHGLPEKSGVPVKPDVPEKSSLLPEGDKSVPVFLYCNQGYRSEIAANCLAEAGYDRVYYFEWED